MEYTLRELAGTLDARWIGNGDMIIKGVRRNPEVSRNHITAVYTRGPELPGTMKRNIAGIENETALFSNQVREGFHCIVVAEKDTVEKYKELLNIFARNEHFNTGIHPTAVVGENVGIGEQTSLGANVVVGDNVTIGWNTVVAPNVTIYPGVVIGDNCTIHSGAVIRGGVEIGNNVEIDCNASIGCNTSEIRVRQIKDGVLNAVPTVGKITIGDNVHIGANSVLIRGLADETVIGDGTFIDTLVNINYGVKTAEEVQVYARSALNDYVTIGEKAIICAKCAVHTRVRIGKRGYVIAGSMVKNHVGDYEKIAGAIPAKSKKEWFRLWGNITRLPWVRDHFKEMKKKGKK